MQKAHYSPPWANTSIVGVAGCSGSGKTSLSLAIVESLNLPWVVVLPMDSFYKIWTPEQSEKAFKNEFDFDSPDAIDFDLLVERLKDLKQGRKAEIPIYSFEKHSRLEKTHTVYAPHVLILEGILALHDPRVLDMLDLKIFTEADADLCLSRRLVRDVRDRGRDIEGCIKQWFSFVKPNFHRYVKWQREVADIIVPRGIENHVAIGLVVDHIRKTLTAKSRLHQNELKRLGTSAEDSPLTSNVVILDQTPQIVGINAIILEPTTDREDFIFYFNRLATMLIEKLVAPLHLPQAFVVLTVENRAHETVTFVPKLVTTPVNRRYRGLAAVGETSAVVVLRGGSILEPALRRVLPDCMTGRILIHTSAGTGEPELHFRYLAPNIADHSRVLLLDPQMSSGGAALMAVRVLVDHGVREERIVFVTYFAGRKGLGRLISVFPHITVIVCRVGKDLEERWIEEKYLGC